MAVSEDEAKPSRRSRRELLLQFAAFGVQYVGNFARMKIDTERRSGTRIAARVSTRVRTPQGADQTAQTRDVSANGVFLYTKSRMEKEYGYNHQKSVPIIIEGEAA